MEGGTARTPQARLPGECFHTPDARAGPVMPRVRVVGREGGSEDSGLPHSHVTSSPADDRDKAGRIPMPRTPPGTPGMPFQPELGRAANSLAPGGEGPRAPPGEPLQTRWPSQGQGCRCRRSWHPHDTHTAAVPCRPHRRRWPDVGLRTRPSSRACIGPLSDGPCAESFGSAAAVPGTESPSTVSPWQGRGGSTDDTHGP